MTIRIDLKGIFLYNNDRTIAKKDRIRGLFDVKIKKHLLQKKNKRSHKTFNCINIHF